MLSPDLQGMFSEFEARNPKATTERRLQGLFIDIALAIARMRNDKGISQRELARRLHTSHPVIRRWESPGYEGYTLSKLVALAQVLDHIVEVKFVPEPAVKTATSEAPKDWGQSWHVLKDFKKAPGLSTKSINTKKEVLL